jgi:hypothetical protein
VVGARFANPRRKGQPTGDRQMEILLCEPGEPVTLKPEPTNKADQNAIAVYSKHGVQMGYISAERTVLLHRAWSEARDVSAIFQRATAYGAVIRVSFDGNIPSLPPPGLVPDVPDSDPADSDPWPDSDGRWDAVDEMQPEK